jgi:hypothetical protein
LGKVEPKLPIMDVFYIFEKNTTKKPNIWLHLSLDAFGSTFLKGGKGG